MIPACSGAGLAATLGQLLLTYRYSLAPAPQIGPYTYSAVVFAAINGWIPMMFMTRVRL